MGGMMGCCAWRAMSQHPLAARFALLTLAARSRVCQRAAIPATRNRRIARFCNQSPRAAVYRSSTPPPQHHKGDANVKPEGFLRLQEKTELNLRVNHEKRNYAFTGFRI